MRVLAILSLSFAASMACGSECICQKPDGSFHCVAHIFGLNQHDCAGYCRDRTCAGRDGQNRTCRIWKGFCDPDAYEKYMEKTRGGTLEYCDEDKNKKYNDCPENYDCPSQ